MKFLITVKFDEKIAFPKMLPGGLNHNQSALSPSIKKIQNQTSKFKINCSAYIPNPGTTVI